MQDSFELHSDCFSAALIFSDTEAICIAYNLVSSSFYHPEFYILAYSFRHRMPTLDEVVLSFWVQCYD